MEHHIRQQERLESKLNTIIVFLVLLLVESLGVGFCILWMVHSLENGFAVK